VLENLSLSIEAGDFVAVVGQSGTGKTTLLRLLVGFQTPWSGELWLWGREQSNLSLTELRRRVTLVEQEPFLFSGPLLDNLIYGHPDASVEQIETAVRKVGLTEVLERLPEGILTPMAEAGRQLSGGERQRLALARALLREPEILVLDEATSALDGRSEASLFEHLGDWLARRTVILVSHRLSTVMLARRALVLGGGRIVDDGPPKSLLAAAGPFRDLFASQLSGLKSE
jgi:ATP-binding cassette subfamily B protein